MASIAQTRAHVELPKEKSESLKLWPVKVRMPFRFRPEPRWNEDELLAFNSANGDLRWEMESDGTIIMMTPAGFLGNKRELYVARKLDAWAESDGRGEAVGDNAGFTLPDGSLLSPDAAWIANSQFEGISKAQMEKYLPRCPNFVIEVISANDTLSETEAKMQRWMANGAELGWVIDPYGASVTVFRQGRVIERLERPVEMCGEGSIAGFVLKMERLWA